jgi:hypothetical protein
LTVLAEALCRFEPPWIEVGRVFRRICFLRFEGLASEAQRIEENEFAEATARALGASGSGPEGESILRTVLTEERERVSQAIAFAEVLVPMLAKRLAGLPGHAAALAEPAPRRGKARVFDADRGIADFIDDMLAQERTG